MYGFVLDTELYLLIKSKKH